jgi:hypothetical protein
VIVTILFHLLGRGEEFVLAVAQSFVGGIVPMIRIGTTEDIMATTSTSAVISSRISLATFSFAVLSRARTATSTLSSFTLTIPASALSKRITTM